MESKSCPKKNLFNAANTNNKKEAGDFPSLKEEEVSPENIIHSSSVIEVIHRYPTPNSGNPFFVAMGNEEEGILKFVEIDEYMLLPNNQNQLDKFEVKLTYQMPLSEYRKKFVQ